MGLWKKVIPVSAFAKTRAAAEYAGRRVRTGLNQSRAAVLLERLDACEAALAGEDGLPPVVLANLLRGVVLATRQLAGPVWLEASCEDPDVAAFIALQATVSPPAPDRIDEICSRVLWARFAPAPTAGAEAGDDEAPAGSRAHGGKRRGGRARLDD
jgi:hypothetical protein